MRTLEIGLAAHLASGATTLATCWRLERADGEVLGFTDHDAALAFGGTDYLPMHGLDGGEAASRLGAGVTTAEVVGVLASEAIAEADILMGRFDGAEVQTWRVNWRDVSQRWMVRRASIGEIVREDGVFRAELRSPQAALNRVGGRVYQSLCDAELGDARCGVDIEDAGFRADVEVVAVRDRFRLEVTGAEAFAPGWFGFGTATWGSGVRAGLVDRIATHVRIGTADVLGLSVPAGEWVAPGDLLVARAGCDRGFATCGTKFGNALNFRGFPHVPGSDFVLRYPRAGDALDGRKLVG